MKMKKIYAAVLAAILTLSLTLPAYAEGEALPLNLEQTELPTDSEQTPSEEEQPSETLNTPDDTVDPDVPEETEPPPENPPEEEPSETPGGPGEVPDDPSETPDDPGELPDDPSETPDDPGELPDDPSETPDDPGGVLDDPSEAPEAPAEDLLPETPEELPDNIVPTPEPEGPFIEVVVPSIGSAIINPYGLPVMMDGQETTAQIAGNTMVLENRSSVAVDVSASAVGTAYGGVVFTDQPPVSTAWAKEVFLYVEFQPLLYLGEEPFWLDSFDNASNQLMVTSYGLEKDGLLRLEAAELPYSWGAVRLSGSVAVYPELPWEDGDGFQVNLAFTFTPADVISDEPNVPPNISDNSTLDGPFDIWADDVQPVGPLPDPFPDSPSELPIDSDTEQFPEYVSDDLSETELDETNTSPIYPGEDAPFVLDYNNG